MATSCRYSHRTGRCKNSSRGRLSSRCTRSAKSRKCVLKKSYKKLRRESHSRRHSRSRKHSRKSHSRKHSRKSHSRKHSHKDVKDIKIKSSLSRGKGQLYRDLKYQEFMKKFSKKLRKHGYSKDNVHKIAQTEFYRRFPSMKKYSS